MSESIIIRCEHCGREVEIPEEWAWQTMKCPLCEKLIEVPNVNIVKVKSEKPADGRT
jgi:hypothetical protein